MNVSETWLREWVKPPVSGEALATQLTMAGLEVDAMTPVAPIFTHVVTAKVVSTRPHPNADRLTLCEVDHGSPHGNIPVVCGGRNVRPGLNVVLARVGAKLPNGLVIKKAKLRGEPSEGMLCAYEELGLPMESDGIIELPEDAPVGENIRKYFNLDDQILALDLTPNRADCFSMLGVAREVAVLNDVSLTHPDIPSMPQDIQDIMNVVVKAETACPLYHGCIIKGINPQAETPLWLFERLRRAGVRPVHPVVDVANLVMLAFGQPMHAFDLSTIEGKICVRHAKADESLTLLDEQTVDLAEDTLIIADDTKPLAIAGVMGGDNSAVKPETTDIFLECAFFNPAEVIGVARRYAVSSEAAQRFERGVDPTLPAKALAYAASLIQEIVGGKVGPVVCVESAKHLPKQQTITFHPHQVKRLTGVDMPEETIQRYLTGLGMVLECTSDAWQITVPPHRFDISLEEDIVEEVIRLWGYANIPTAPTDEVLQVGLTHPQDIVLAQVMQCVQQRGYLETISYSFVDPDVQAMVYPDDALPLLNPISSELSVMRLGLWPGLLSSVVYNAHRQQSHLKLFESGIVFRPEGSDVIERHHIGGIVMGTVGEMSWNEPSRPIDFFDIKGDVEAICQSLNVLDEIQVVPEKHTALHPGQSARLMKGDRTVGWVGMLHPQLSDALDLPKHVAMFELCLDSLQSDNVIHYQPISKYPSVRRDFSLLVDEQTPVAEIEHVVKQVIPPVYLKAFDVFDHYVGETIPAGKKSIAIALTLQDDKRTLIDDDVNTLMDALVSRLGDSLGITLRE